jgi:hypothetical protein
MKPVYVADVTEPVQPAPDHITSPNPPPLAAAAEHDLLLDTIKKPAHAKFVVWDVHVVQFESMQEYSVTLLAAHVAL